MTKKKVKQPNSRFKFKITKKELPESLVDKMRPYARAQGLYAQLKSSGSRVNYNGQQLSLKDIEDVMKELFYGKNKT